MSNDLVAFIAARLDEDEAAARAAAAGGRWRYEDGDSIGAWTLYDEHWNIASLKTYRHETYDYAERMPAMRDPEYVDADANGRHIARHDPARVLREVDAKRAILEAEQDRVVQEGPLPERLRDMVETDIIKFLALPYADHADYRQEWAP